MVWWKTWQGFYCRFLDESKGERILKISKHLASGKVMNGKYRWSFLTHSVYPHGARLGLVNCCWQQTETLSAVHSVKQALRRSRNIDQAPSYYTGSQIKCSIYSQNNQRQHVSAWFEWHVNTSFTTSGDCEMML